MTIITFNLESLRAIAPHISKEQSRYYLCCVYIHNGNLVATDGTTMAIINCNRFVGDKNTTCKIPAATVAQLLKFKPKNREQITVRLSPNAPLWDAVLYSDKNGEIVHIPFKETEGNYPDYQRVISEVKCYKAPSCIASYEAKLLARFQAFSTFITIYPANVSSTATIIRAQTEDYKSFGLIMPKKQCDNFDIIPEFVK